MKWIYLKLTRLIDINLLNILIGLVSGLAINLVTSDSITAIICIGIGCLFASITCLFGLIWVRQGIDDSFSRLQEVTLGFNEKWETATDLDNSKRKIRFFSFFLFFITFMIIGIILSFRGESKSQNISAGKGDVNRQINELTKKVDSLILLIHNNMPQKLSLDGKKVNTLPNENKRRE